MAAFRLTPNPVGPGRIEIDGEDVTDRVAGVQVDAAIGQPTVVTLHVQAGGVIEGEGIVQVATSGGDDASIICAFLDRVDPEILNDRALRSLGPGNNDLTAAMLKVLCQLARGED